MPSLLQLCLDTSIRTIITGTLRAGFVHFVHASCTLRARFVHVQASCRLRAGFVHASCTLRAGFVQASCRLRAGFVHVLVLVLVLPTHYFLNLI